MLMNLSWPVLKDQVPSLFLLSLKSCWGFGEELSLDLISKKSELAVRYLLEPYCLSATPGIEGHYVQDALFIDCSDWKA